MNKEIEETRLKYIHNITELQNNAHDYDWEEINEMAFQIEDYVRLVDKSQNGIYISNEEASEAIDAFNDILFSHLDDDDEWYYKDKIKLVKQALGGK